MRTALAIVTPNVTLPIWLHRLRQSIKDVVDQVVLIVGHHDPTVLEWAKHTVDASFPGPHPSVIARYSPHNHNHGRTLTETVVSHKNMGEVMLLEDDCFLWCNPSYIDNLFNELRYYHFLGSCMATGNPKYTEMELLRFPELDLRLHGLDTYGAGFYPNMAFFDLDLLRQVTDCDFTSRVIRGTSQEDGLSFKWERLVPPEYPTKPVDEPLITWTRGRWTRPGAVIDAALDIGHWIGIQLHLQRFHLLPPSHIPQCRLTEYPGCVKVSASWNGPWLHVGQMSQPPHWTKPELVCGNRYEETLAAFDAALDLDMFPPPLPKLKETMRWAIGVARRKEGWDEQLFGISKQLMERVYQGGPA